jgi:two-component system sensor histidine kinase VicK
MSTHETRIQELSSALEQERKARLQAEAELAAVRQSQQEFISLVTHELRIPMTAIQGYTDLLIKAIMGPVNATQLNFLKTIRANVERMSRLVADLSDINKINGNQLQLKPQPVDLYLLMDELVDEFIAITSDKALSIETEFAESLAPVWCDPDRLQQILSNLLRNAVQYTPAGGKITMQAGVDPENPQNIQIQVSDSGIGIPEDQQDHVFEMFFRSADEETRQTSGNGLALHLSKLLLEMQDGSINFVSTRGKGSTFTMTLPFADS